MMIPYWTRVTGVILALFVGLGPMASAQDDGLSVLEAQDLGVSLARIQRQLDRLPDDPAARSVLRLNYYIQVYGRTPPLDLFEGFDIHNSPVPYGAPTHTDLMSVMHDNPVYPTAVNLNPIAGWAWKSLR